MDWTKVSQTFIRWAFGLGIVIAVSGTVVELKGTTTTLDLNIVVSLLGKGFFLTICAIITVGAVVWALIERGTRIQTVKKHGKKARSERLLDSGRSSSNLTPEGKTNPEDN